MKRPLIFLALALLAGAGVWLLTLAKASSEGILNSDPRSPLAGRRIVIIQKGFDWCDFHPTPQQGEKMSAIMGEVHQQDLILNLEEQKDKIELAEMLLNPNPSQPAMYGKLDQILAIQKEKQEHMIAAYFQIRKILKPDQQAGFACMIIQHITGGPPGIEQGPPPPGTQMISPGTH